jgi:hypothetical protein
MSDHAHSGGDAEHDSGADAVDYSKVIGVGVASLALFALSIWWAGTILHSKTAEVEAKTGVARAVDTKRDEIGIVDQVPFAADHRLAKWRFARRAELESYGWVDKSQGKVHIPIEVAVDKILSGTMPPGAPK